MTPVSFAGTGTYIIVIETVAQLFGLDFPAGSVEGAVNAVVVLIGFGFLIVGQLRRPDLHFGLFRKS